MDRFEIPDEVASSQRGAKGDLYLPDGICQIIMDELFWSNISQLSILIQPYCGALDKLQADEARLFDFVLSFGYFIKFWEQNSSRPFAESLISRLKKLWKDWEQPLLLLSLVLHPKYRLT